MTTRRPLVFPMLSPMPSQKGAAPSRGCKCPPSLDVGGRRRCWTALVQLPVCGWAHKAKARMDRNQNQDGRQRKTMQCAHERVAGGTSYLTMQHRQLQDEEAAAPLKTMVAAMTLLPPVAPWPRVGLCLCLTRGVEGWEARAEVRRCRAAAFRAGVPVRRRGGQQHRASSSASSG